MPGEVMTPVTTSDALRQAEVLAMRQLSDSLGVLNRTVERLSGDVRKTSDAVIRLEAQELKTAILEVKAEVQNTVRELRDDHEDRLGKVEDRLTKAEQAIARMRGAIIPLSALGSALLAGLLSFVSIFAVSAITHH